MHTERLERRTHFDGQFDPSFGGGSPSFLDLSGGTEFVNDVAVDHNGRVIVCGYFRPQDAAGNGPAVMLIARFNSDGTLDTSFADNGRYLNTPQGHERANDIIVLPDGSFVVLVSSEFDPRSHDAMKFNANGRRDRTFGTGPGELQASISADDVLLLPDGKLLLVGSDTRTGAEAHTIAQVERYHADGILDRAFAQDGRFLGPDAGAQDRSMLADAGAIDALGRIYLGLSEPEIVDTSTGFFLVDRLFAARLTPDGQLDPTYGDGGIVRAPADRTLDFRISRTLALEADGSVLVRIVPHPDTDERGAIRITPNGTLGEQVLFSDLDPRFAPPESAGDSIFVQPDGKLLVPGASGDVLRLRPDLTLDKDFGDGAIVRLAEGIGETRAAPAPDGTIVLATAAPPVDLETDSQVAVGRFFIGDGPVASLKARRITPDQATISQVLTVTYRDGDNFIDTDGLDNRDLRVTGPNGFVQYARFKGFATFNGIAVVATYKLPPPGGNWFFADAGEYVVQLVGRQVADVGGRFAAGRVLGRFVLAL